MVSIDPTVLSILAKTPFSYFYNLSPPNRSRDRPLQVLALGLSGCGTKSLKLALEELGYGRLYHGFECTEQDAMAWCRLLDRRFKHEKNIGAEEIDRIVGDCEAITDTHVGYSC